MKRLRKLLPLVLAAAGLPAAADAEESPDSAGMLKIPAVETRPSGTAATESSAAPSPGPPETAMPASEPPAEPEAGDEGVVPPAFPLSRYQPLWERSPFQLESVAPPVESAGLAQRFALTGIAEINREPIAFVMERATQKRIMVKKDEGENGVSLVQVDVQKNYNDSTVTLRQGAEVGVVRFDAAAAPPMAVLPPGLPPQRMTPGMPPPGIPQVPQTPGIPTAARIPPGQVAQPGQPLPPGQQAPAPGIVPPVPGPGVPQNGQVQSDPGQAPPPRVIRRRALIPAAP